MLRYAKALVAGGVTLGAYFLELAKDDLVTGDDWRLLLVAAIGIGVTYVTPNKAT